MISKKYARHKHAKALQWYTGCRANKQFVLTASRSAEFMLSIYYTLEWQVCAAAAKLDCQAWPGVDAHDYVRHCCVDTLLDGHVADDSPVHAVQSQSEPAPDALLPLPS